MKSPMYCKKGQYAVPGILIGTVALLMIYLILVYPSERAKLLGSDEVFDNAIKESPLGEDTKLIYSSGRVVEVGRSIGQTVLEYDLKNALADQTAVVKTLDSVTDRTMKSSVFTSDSEIFSANNLNLDNTKEIVISLKISELKGTPKIVVYLNDTKIYEKTPTIGDLNIRIQPSLLDENTNEIIVKVESAGFSIIQSDSVYFETMSVKQYYYDFTKAVSETESVYIPQNQYKGSIVHVQFDVAESTTDGDLIIKIGQQGVAKRIVWTGAPEANQTVVASFDLEDNVKIGTNEIQFEADKDGKYAIENVTLKFIAESALPASEVYSFDIGQEYLYSSNRIILGIQVDRIIEPGYLFFKISPSQTSYYFPTEDLAAGTWSYVTLDDSKLSELGNKITVDSVNGRFKIDGFVIIADYN